MPLAFHQSKLVYTVDSLVRISRPGLQGGKVLFIENNRMLNRTQSNANRNQSNQSGKSLENLIDLITVRLIRSIENQSND